MEPSPPPPSLPADIKEDADNNAVTAVTTPRTSIDLSRTPFPPPYPSPIIEQVLTANVVKVCLTYCSLGDHGCLTGESF